MAPKRRADATALGPPPERPPERPTKRPSQGPSSTGPSSSTASSSSVSTRDYRPSYYFSDDESIKSEDDDDSALRSMRSYRSRTSYAPSPSFDPELRKPPEEVEYELKPPTATRESSVDQLNESEYGYVPTGLVWPGTGSTSGAAGEGSGSGQAYGGATERGERERSYSVLSEFGEGGIMADDDMWDYFANRHTPTPTPTPRPASPTTLPPPSRSEPPRLPTLAPVVDQATRSNDYVSLEGFDLPPPPASRARPISQTINELVRNDESLGRGPAPASRALDEIARNDDFVSLAWGDAPVARPVKTLTARPLFAAEEEEREEDEWGSFGADDDRLKEAVSPGPSVASESYHSSVGPNRDRTASSDIIPRIERMVDNSHPPREPILAEALEQVNSAQPTSDGATAPSPSPATETTPATATPPAPRRARPTPRPVVSSYNTFVVKQKLAQQLAADTSGMGFRPGRDRVDEPDPLPEFARSPTPESPPPEAESGVEASREPSSALVVPLGAAGAECSRRARMEEEGTEGDTPVAQAEPKGRPTVQKSLNLWASYVLSRKVVTAKFDDPMTMTPIEPVEDEFSLHLLQADTARLQRYDPTIPPVRLNLPEFGCDQGMKLIHNVPGGDLAEVWYDLERPEPRTYKPTRLDYEPNEEAALSAGEWWVECARKKGVQPGELEDVLDRTFRGRGNLDAIEALGLIAHRNWVWFNLLIGWARIRKRYIELAAPEVIASAAAKITEQARERAAQVEAKLNRCKFGSQLRCKLVTCCQPAQAGFERWVDEHDEMLNRLRMVRGLPKQPKFVQLRVCDREKRVKAVFHEQARGGQ